MRSPALFHAALLLTLAFSMNPAQSAVRASVDRTSVSADGTIELLLEHDGQTPGEPDLSPLKQDFDVLSSSRSSNVQIINGSMTSSVRLELSLSPKHNGQIRIPALTWGSEKSDPLVVNVGGASSSNSATQAAGSGAGSGAVYLKTSIELQHPYVQAAVDLTVRLYAAVPLYHAQLEFPAGNDVLVQQVGADRSETVVENGQRYQVIERHYDLFPQRSGTLRLPGPVLSAQIAVQDRNNPFGNSFKDLLGNLPFNSAFTSTRPIEVHSDEINLDVLPRPAAAGTQYWLPSAKVTLEGEWRPAQGPVKVGDPVTLDLHLKAEGLTAAQLPDLNSLLKLPDGVKAYPDQAKLTNDTQGNIVVGQREQSIALIADRDGEFTLPSLSVRWWDVNGNQARDATLPARTLTFTPAQGAPSTPSPAASPPAPVTSPASNPALTAPADQHPRSANAHWFWASLVLGVLWVLTLIAWYFTRRPPSQPSAQIVENAGAPVAEGRFREACRRNDARAARASLLAWLGAAYPEKRPICLRSFAGEMADPNSAQLLEDLDRACYGGGSWQGADLLRAFQKLPGPRAGKRVHRDELEPLYK